MRLFHNTNIDFINKRKTFFLISSITITLAIILTIVIGPVMSIDFTGGTEIGVKFEKPIEAEQVRNAVDNAGIEGAEIKSFGTANAYLIRVKDSGEAASKIQDALTTSLASNPHTILKVDKIGPKIGGEVTQDATIAVILSVISILIYVGFRFEFIYGLGATVALIHDVIIAFTFTVIFNKLGILNLEISQSTLAALLTVLGFSINDTVVIFDRIRENLQLHKGKSISEIFNLSINETLGRTINTSFTACIVLFIIVLFGGPVLQGFAFTMLVGFIVGVYSSVFIAGSFIIWYSTKSNTKIA